MNSRFLPSILWVLGFLAVVQASVRPQPISPPFSYDFEAEPTCSTLYGAACPLVGPFTNLTDDDFDWTVDAGGTLSLGTGPSVDKNPGTITGKYLYTEATGGTAGDTAKLLSPLFDLTGVTYPRIRFGYHMYGADMGTMHVDLIERINAGNDGMTAGFGGLFGTAGPSASFTPAHVGTQIEISGSALGNDGKYLILYHLGPNVVEVHPWFGPPETGLAYVHEATTLDVIPPWTDNQDLWQEQSVAFGASHFLGGGNSNAFQVVIRGERGAGYQSDMAIDDFGYDSYAPDVGVVSILQPPIAVGAGTHSVEILIQNFGSTALTDIPVSFSVDGGPPITETYVGTIVPAGTDTYTFTAPANFITDSGPAVVTACTAYQGDVNSSNDCENKMCLVLEVIGIFPYQENFEGGPVPGGYWPNGINVSWALGPPAKAVINSAASGYNCWVTGGLAGLYPNNEESYVIFPIFDLGALTNPVIQLNILWETEFSLDGAALQSSIDGGTTWDNVGMFGDPHNWYNDPSVSALGFTNHQEGWSGGTATGNGSGTWVPASHSLAGLTDQPHVVLRIAFGSDGAVQSEGFAFDDVTIIDMPTPYPGTPGGDLVLGTGVNAVASSGVLTFVKTATALDVLNIEVSSTTGTYDYHPFILLAQVFNTGTPPTPTIPGLLWIDLFQPFVILVDLEPFLTQVVAPGGTVYSAVCPPGFASQSLIFQAACVSPALCLTDAYEIQIMQP